MRMKFSTNDRELSGYMYGWPMLFLWAIAAIVGTLASRRIVEISTCSWSNGSRLSW